MKRRDFLTGFGALVSGMAGCAGQESTPTPGVKTRIITKTNIVRKTPRPTATGTPRERPNTIFVGPDGSDSNLGSIEAPLSSIQTALSRANSGTTVFVKSGEYRERIEPPRGGDPGNPITLTGPPDAVLKSHPDHYNLVLIRRNHFHITGLTIDGLENPDKPEKVDSYSRAQLVQARPEVDSDEYLSDIIVAPHRIGSSQKSLISLERTMNGEVGPFEIIGPAGAKYLYSDQEGHNGEFVYLGTDPSNLGKSWHPWTENDKTSNIRVHHIDNSEGYAHSRLVQTKPGVQDITIEYCTDGGGTEIWREGTSSSVFFECHRATIRWCILKDGDGAGISIGSPLAQKDDATAAEQESGSMNSYSATE